MAYSAILYRRPIFYKISASGETPPAPSISVTYTNSVGGTISTSGQTDVTEGTPFSNVATANTLFNFVEWLLSEDGGVTWVSISTDAELNYVYEGDSQSVTVKAMFEPDALNFYMPNGGTITLTRNGTPTVVELEYSIDGGATWQIWEEVGNVRSLTLAAGQKMYVRNTSETSTEFSTNGNYYQFALSQITYAGGKIDSLLCKNADDAILKSVCFYRLFLNQNNLLSMPLFSEKTSIYGFREMFRGCNGLVETTLLKATTLNIGAYMGMFQSCQNLSKVRTLMTDISGTNSTTSWLLGVSNTGDFYCPAELTIPTGVNGIPSGWTRHDI